MTNAELFFGKNARFNISQLKIRHVEHTVVDSTQATMSVDTVNHTINLPLLYQNDADTLSIQVGGLKPEFLYIATGVVNPCCSKVVVTEATLDGTILFKVPAGPKKAANSLGVLTVPL